MINLLKMLCFITGDSKETLINSKNELLDLFSGKTVRNNIERELVFTKYTYNVTNIYTDR